MKTALNNIVRTISGSWGTEDFEGNGVNIIRTTNFRNDGKIDFTNVVKRSFLKKVIDENGRERFEVDSDKINANKLQPEDILIEKSGGGPDTPIGRVVFFEQDDDQIYLNNNFTQILRADSDKVFPKYLFYYLRYLYTKGVVLKYQNQTTGLANLKLEKYLKEEIFIPEFDRQRVVSTQLDIIQQNIDFKKSIIDILSRLCHSIYFQFFGDPINNQKIFPLKKLRQITATDKIITYGIVQAGPHIENGIPYIRTGDVKNGKIITNNILKTSNEVSDKYSRTLCTIDDVIITIRATIGETAIITTETDGYNLSRGVAIISPNKKSINPKYLLATLHSDGFQFIINKYIKGSTFKEITLEKLREIKIPVPSDLKLQNKFGEIYDAIEDIKEKVEQSLDILQQLFQVILQNAFREDAQIEEEPIFKDLIKKFSIQDLQGNKQRLQYLINLFEQQNFDEFQDFTNARKILFELMESEEIVQVLDHGKVKLQVK